MPTPKLCFKADANWKTPTRDATPAERRVFTLLEALEETAGEVLDSHGDECQESGCWICDDAYFLKKNAQMLLSHWANYRVLLEPIPEPESDTPVILERLG